MTLLQTECRTLADEQKKLLEDVARREMGLQQSAEDSRVRAAAGEATKRELETLDQQVEAAQQELEREAPECAKKVAEAERLAAELERADAEVQQLDSKQARATQFSSRQERDKHLNKEAAELRAKIKRSDQQVATSPKPSSSDNSAHFFLASQTGGRRRRCRQTSIRPAPR